MGLGTNCRVFVILKGWNNLDHLCHNQTGALQSQEQRGVVLVDGAVLCHRERGTVGTDNCHHQQCISDSGWSASRVAASVRSESILGRRLPVLPAMASDSASPHHKSGAKDVQLLLRMVVLPSLI